MGGLDLLFTNTGALYTVNQIKVTSANDLDTDVSQAELFVDLITPANSVGTAVFAGGVATITPAAPISIPASGIRHVYVAYDIAAVGESSSGHILDASIAAGDITMTNSGTNLDVLTADGETTIDTDKPDTSTPTVIPDPYNTEIDLITSGSDATSPIIAAEYYIGSDPCASTPGTCYAMTASDGVFDELTEDVTATVDISLLSDASHSVYVRVKDSANNWDTTVAGKSFTKDGTAPITTLNPIASPRTSNLFTVSGTSIDATTNIINLQWKYSTEGWAASGKATIPDDGAFNGKTEPFHFEVGPLADGTYTINVRAVDAATNVEGDKSATFCIDSAEPDANIGGPYVVSEGTPITFDASASSDPTPNCGILNIAWDLDNDGGYDDGNGATASATWGDEGVHTIKIEVTDGTGNVAYDETIVTVNNVAPSITAIISSSPIDEGSATTFSATATDPGSDDVTLNYDINWGDGTAHTRS